MQSPLSPEVRQLCQWYKAERPPWHLLLEREPSCSWQEHEAFKQAVYFIQRTDRIERTAAGTWVYGSELTTQQVWENHTAWLFNLAEAQLTIWKNTPRT